MARPEPHGEGSREDGILSAASHPGLMGCAPDFGLGRIKQSSLNSECICLDPDRWEAFKPEATVSFSKKLLHFLNKGKGLMKWPVCQQLIGSPPC